jgi:hypothetical protein
MEMADDTRPPDDLAALAEGGADDGILNTPSVPFHADRITPSLNITLSPFSNYAPNISLIKHELYRQFSRQQRRGSRG